MFGGAHAQKGFAREHKGPNVERAAFDARIPVFIGHQRLLDGLQKQLFGDFGHRHAFRAGVKAARVFLRTEQAERAVRVAIGLHAFEYFLSVMQHAGGWIESDGRTGLQGRRVPTTADGTVCPLVIINHHHVIGKDGAKTGIGYGRSSVGLARWRGVGDALKFHESGL